MALDFGERRIGVALSDPTGTVAQPLETIERSRAAPGAHLERIADLAREHEVDRIVVGLPIHMDGRAGEEAERARRFGEEVARATGCAVDFLDERWTSLEAERALREAGLAGRRRRGVRDRVAAAILLRAYLERSRP